MLEALCIWILILWVFESNLFFFTSKIIKSALTSFCILRLLIWWMILFVFDLLSWTSEVPPWTLLVAGTSASCVAQLISYPLVVIRTRLQAQRTGDNSTGYKGLQFRWKSIKFAFFLITCGKSKEACITPAKKPFDGPLLV